MNLSKTILACLVFPFLVAMQCKKAGKNGAVSTGPPGSIRDSVIVEGLRHPWEILWGPDNHIWMTERGGRVSRVNPNTGQVIPLIDIADVVANGEGGLLGMALHPQFSTTPQVFVVYNYYHSTGDYREKVVRYNYTGSALTNPVILIDQIDASSIHNGSRLLIIDGKLFVTTGDASNQQSSQNLNALNGKILRLNLDGTIPADNPVPGNPYWSFGHRNAQGLVYANNKLYISEHGPITDDEINIIEKSRNYGWPNVNGLCDESDEQEFCNSRQVIEPIKSWTPTIAPAGLDYYNSDLIPQWKNSLLLVALKNARLYQMKLDAGYSQVTETNEYFRNDYGRLRDLCISPSGKVYISSSNGNNDKIIEISIR